MARPHLDWQQLGSLQFSPCADQMGTLTEPTMSQPIMKFAYSATAANQTVPVNAAPALALQPQNEQPYESSYFFPPILYLKTILKTFGRKSNAFNVLRHFSYQRCRWKTRNMITIPSHVLFIPSALHEYCNSDAIVGAAGSLQCSGFDYYFLLTAADNFRRQGLQHYATISPLHCSSAAHSQYISLISWGK